MSHGGSFPFYDSEEYDCRILCLPYRHHLTAMYIIIPNNSTRKGLREFQKLLSAEMIDYMISKMNLTKAIVKFPKLHITNQLDLKAILEQMDLTTLFNEHQSDLSLISNEFVENGHRNDPTIAYAPATRDSPYQLCQFALHNLEELDSLRRTAEPPTNPRLFVDEIIHQIDLIVNEAGTEGAAVTLTKTKRSLDHVIFRAETPFLFLIRHEETKVPIFYGAVFQPKKLDVPVAECNMF